MASILNTICEQRRKDVAEAKAKVSIPLCNPNVSEKKEGKMKNLCLIWRVCLLAALILTTCAVQVSLEELRGQLDTARKEFPPINFRDRLRSKYCIFLYVYLQSTRQTYRNPMHGMYKGTWSLGHIDDRVLLCNSYNTASDRCFLQAHASLCFGSIRIPVTKLFVTGGRCILCSFTMKERGRLWLLSCHAFVLLLRNLPWSHLM